MGMEQIGRWLDDGGAIGCCPDPDPADMLTMDELAELEGSEPDYGADDIITHAGYDPRSTPIDTMMDARMGAGLCVSHYMTHGDPRYDG